MSMYVVRDILLLADFRPRFCPDALGVPLSLLWDTAEAFLFLPFAVIRSCIISMELSVRFKEALHKVEQITEKLKSPSKYHYQLTFGFRNSIGHDFLTGGSTYIFCVILIS
jgi:hypothetical protein